MSAKSNLAIQTVDEISGRSQENLSDIELLHRISVTLIGEQDRFELYGKIVEAAVAITGSQFGTMQLLCPAGDPSGHGGELHYSLIAAYLSTPSNSGNGSSLPPTAVAPSL
jgi:hypothetical protein